MSAILKVKDKDGKTIDIPAIKGDPGEDYVLTDADKAEIAQQAADLIEIPEVDSGGLSDSAKIALLSLLEHVAYTDENGQQYYNALKNALSINGVSNMNEWTSGVAYTDLIVIDNEYVASMTGVLTPYNGWSRTGYIPCNGATSLTVPPYSGLSKLTDRASNVFFDENKAYVSAFAISDSTTTSVDVPQNAHYFMLSTVSETLEACINTGIKPFA